jgi:hypothetical protein
MNLTPLAAGGTWMFLLGSWSQLFVLTQERGRARKRATWHEICYSLGTQAVCSWEFLGVHCLNNPACMVNHMDTSRCQGLVIPQHIMYIPGT